MTTITGGGTGKARGGTGGTITGGRRVGTLRKKWKKGVCQVMSEREEREEVTKGATGGQRRGRVQRQDDRMEAHVGCGDGFGKRDGMVLEEESGGTREDKKRMVLIYRKGS